MRQIVLDTETTGLEPSQGHRVIEIGCVELINRRLTGNNLHIYINPQREIDAGALEVHGISNDFLADKPLFSDIADTFLDFVKDAELVIHNAPFDVGFLNAELSDLNRGYKSMEDYCKILDTLAMARKKHPGQKNNLDALCKRYFVDNTQRELHGALLDAEILADVYLIMTGGQSSFALSNDNVSEGTAANKIKRFDKNRPSLKVIMATEEERSAHQKRLESIQEVSNTQLWQLQKEN
jgi:DNA polymerase III subunit epsilon